MPERKIFFEGPFDGQDAVGVEAVAARADEVDGPDPAHFVVNAEGRDILGGAGAARIMA